MRLGISRSTTEATCTSRTATSKSEGRLRDGVRMRPLSSPVQKVMHVGLGQRGGLVGDGLV